MKSIRQQIEEAVGRALVRVVGPEGQGTDPLVRPTQDPRFGDYQSNVAMSLAKQLGKKPREVAEDLARAREAGTRVEGLGGVALYEPPEVAGPGFINFRVRAEFRAAQLREIQADPRLGVPAVEQPERVVVDF